VVSKIENIDEASVDTVELIFESLKEGTTFSGTKFTTAIGTDGSFSFQLPATFEKTILITDCLDFDLKRFEMSQSPAAAKGMGSRMQGIKDGEYVCGIGAYSKDGNGDVSIELNDIIYADQDVTVTVKTLADDSELKFSLKKGWNMLYENEKATNPDNKYITELPSGVTMKWYYIIK